MLAGGDLSLCLYRQSLLRCWRNISEDQKQLEQTDLAATAFSSAGKEAIEEKKSQIPVDVVPLQPCALPGGLGREGGHLLRGEIARL